MATPSPQRPKPLVLMILDGYGFSPVEEGNAIRKAKQPNMERYLREYPFAAITAAGIEVGLPFGEMGNSETGHQNIGSGRVIYQALPRINRAIENRSFFENPAFLQAIEHVKKNPDAALHIMGLLSNGGTHSHIDHQLALLELVAQQGVGDRTIIHAFLDGRDSPPTSAGNFVRQLAEKMNELGVGKIQTLIGRYYAMDRSSNWDRIKKAYDMLVHGVGEQYPTWEDAIHGIFENLERKNFETSPATIIGSDDTPPRTIKDGDAVIFYNHRPDRARQITAAFVDPSFSEFEVERWNNLMFVSMTEYDENLPTVVAMPEDKVDYPIGRVISEAGLMQLRIAETEKYAHVTYFFDGGREEEFPGETNLMIESHTEKDMSKIPEMKAKEITDKTIEAISDGTYDVIVMNYANADMIGHTGNFEATVKAVEILDEQIGRVVDATLKAGGAILLTCDHGNAEAKSNVVTHKAATDHTNNPVPLLYIAEHVKNATPKDDATVEQMKLTPIGVLADVAPTVLEILGLEKPSSMTAISLLNSLR